MDKLLPSKGFLPRVRGLEMIDPAPFDAEKSNFLMNNKSQPILSTQNLKNQRSSSKNILKQREDNWSTDSHILYVPFKLDPFLSQKLEKEKMELIAKQNNLKNQRKPSNEKLTLQQKKNKKRILINLDDRFTTKVNRESEEPRLSNASSSLPPTKNNKSQVFDSIIEKPKKLENQENVKPNEKKGNTSQSDLSRIVDVTSSYPNSITSQATLETNKQQSAMKRDVLEISSLYLKDPRDIQEVANRRLMFENIRKGNEKRAKKLEQIRAENLVKVMREKPVFKGRGYYFKQSMNELSMDSSVLETDPNQYNDNARGSLKGSMVSGQKKKVLIKQFKNIKLIKRFKMAVRRYKIVTKFWKCIDQAINKKRQLKINTFQINLKDSISNCMKFTLQCGQQSFVKLFKETENLAYYLQAKEKAMYLEKRAILRQHCLNILGELARKTVNAEKDFPFIKLIAKNANNYEFPPQNFWPAFIIKRVEFTRVGSLKNISQNQKEMIAIMFFMIYGLFNRLVRPWTTLKLEQTDILAKNCQLALSSIFYVMHDYLKEKNPIIQNNLQSVDPKYILREREGTLNAYPELLSIESDTQLNKPVDQTKQKIKLDQQIKENDNIIIGISSRKKVEDLVEKDVEFKTKVIEFIQEISKNLLNKADEVYPEIKDKLLNLV